MAARKLAKLKGLQIVATFVSPGVAAGAGGFAIINGKIVKIPPRGPANRLVIETLRSLAAMGKRR